MRKAGKERGDGEKVSEVQRKGWRETGGREGERERQRKGERERERRVI